MTHAFTAAADPRNKDCIRCGRPAENHDRPVRDTEWEVSLLNDIAEWCARAHGENPATLARAVIGRLEKGEGEYGESWKTRDPMELLTEAAEEPPDGVAWALLFLERSRDLVSPSEFEDLQMLVVEFATHLAAAHAVSPRLHALAAQLLPRHS